MFSRATRTAPENADAVGLVVALLVRFPEIATIASHPGTGSIVLSFVVRGRLDRRERDLLREAISEGSTLMRMADCAPYTAIWLTPGRMLMRSPTCVLA